MKTSNTQESSIDFCKRILQDANIAIVPGIAFGKEGFVRFSFGEQEEELIEALIQLKNSSLLAGGN